MAADDGVALPFAREGAVEIAAPDVEDGLAIEENGDRGADVVATFEMHGEHVADAFEARRDQAFDLRAAGHVDQSGPGTGLCLCLSVHPCPLGLEAPREAARDGDHAAARPAGVKTILRSLVESSVS